MLLSKKMNLAIPILSNFNLLAQPKFTGKYFLISFQITLFYQISILDYEEKEKTLCFLLYFNFCFPFTWIFFRFTWFFLFCNLHSSNINEFKFTEDLNFQLLKDLQNSKRKLLLCVRVIAIPCFDVFISFDK